MTADAVGGVWTYALDLARGLAPQGVETVLAILGPAPDPGQRAQADAVPGLSLRPTALPLDWLAGDPAEVLAAGVAIAAMARAAEADLVHLNSPVLAAAGGFPAPVLGVCHSCVATWWAATQGGAMPADFRWRTDLLRHGYEACTLLAAPSHAFAAATAGAYRLRRMPAVVHNGRAPLPAPGTRPAGAPADFVFTMGRLWDAGKNVLALDRAAAGLPLPVLAAGPLHGPEGSAVAPRHIRTLGRLGDRAVADWLHARPVYAAPARYEPFGLAVLEAALAGCALVLSDIPSFREIWGDAAHFVPAEDAAAIATAITRLIEDRPARERLGAAAQHRAGRYTTQSMGAAMLDLYRDLLNHAASGKERVA